MREPRTSAQDPPPRAIVVLGCRVGPALSRRAEAGAEAWRAGADLVVVSGGRTWPSAMEADWLASRLGELGVPFARIVRERCSFTTRENARFSAELLARRGVREVTVVSCAWHLPRARALFERHGLRVSAWPTREPAASPARRVYRRVREWVAARLDGAA